MSVFSLNNVTKEYPGNITALRGVSLSAGKSDLIVLSGPSGAGKSVLLRILSGLEQPSSGEAVRPAGTSVVPETLLPRRILRKEMIRLIRKAGVSGKAEIAGRVSKLAERLGFAEFLGRRIMAIPEGKKRIAAFACALAAEPELLIADEPLRGLDPEECGLVLDELASQRRERGMAAVLAVSDPRIAAELGGSIVLMRNGEAEAPVSADELIRTPGDAFRAKWSGMLLLPVLLKPSEGKMFACAGDDGLRVPDLTVRRFLSDAYIGKNVLLGIRPEHLTLNGTDAAGFRAEVCSRVPLGDGALWVLRCGGCTFRVRTAEGAEPTDGTIRVLPDEGKIFFFDEKTGASILR